MPLKPLPARCTTCHMPPARRNNQDEAPHGHSMGTIVPADSADAIAAGKKDFELFAASR